MASVVHGVMQTRRLASSVWLPLRAGPTVAHAASAAASTTTGVVTSTRRDRKPFLSASHSLPNPRRWRARARRLALCDVGVQAYAGDRLSALHPVLDTNDGEDVIMEGSEPCLQSVELGREAGPSRR